MSQRILQILSAAVLLAALAVPAFADARIEQKTQTQFTGAVGKAVNIFGGKAAREGVVTATAVQGGRKMSSARDHGQLVDLAAEKVYDIDFDGKTYKVSTFEQIRQRMKEDLERARKESAAKPQPEEKGPEYEVDFDLKESGKTEQISGFDCREVVTTITVREKGKKLEVSGGAVLTAHLWLGPKLKELEERAGFERRYAERLGLMEMIGGREMAAAMMAQPALQQALKKLEEKKVDMNGSAMRTVMTLETVARPGQAAEAEKSEDSGGGPRSLGGLFGKPGKKLAKKDDSAKEGAAGGPPRDVFMTATTELLKVASQVAPADVSIPAGFKQKS